MSNTLYENQILAALLNSNIAFANETISVTAGTVYNLTVPSGADYCLITVEGTASTDGIRFWLDGTTPTSSNGIFRGNGAGFDIKGGSNIAKFKAYGIGVGVVLQVQYYR
jgi:hypothetical protein